LRLCHGLFEVACVLWLVVVDDGDEHPASAVAEVHDLLSAVQGVHADANGAALGPDEPRHSDPPSSFVPVVSVGPVSALLCHAGWRARPGGSSFGLHTAVDDHVISARPVHDDERDLMRAQEYVQVSGVIGGVLSLLED